MTQVLIDSSTKTLKTLLGILLGLASIIAGWIIYSAEGFYSPALMVSGALMMPVGLVLFGISLTEVFENLGNIFERHGRRKRE